MKTLKCECGKEIDSLRRKRCDNCRKARKREKNKLNARKHREKYGSQVTRGIFCSSCKGIKEHKNRGYCLLCERKRYLLRNKADCATCGVLKENVRDVYCKKCKREKYRLKSLAEGKRFKNSIGLNPVCSRCGNQKEGSYLSDAWCGKCRMAYKKSRRPYRSEEQKYKEAVRKMTLAKIKQGKLSRKPCEICGIDKVDAHHDDYFKPLDVRWLCKKHHIEHHKLERKKLT